MSREKVSAKAIEVIRRHKAELQKDIDDENLLPLFIDALQTGGLKLFDEIRYMFEYCEIDLKDELFKK